MRTDSVFAHLCDFVKFRRISSASPAVSAISLAGYGFFCPLLPKLSAGNVMVISDGRFFLCAQRRYAMCFSLSLRKSRVSLITFDPFSVFAKRLPCLRFS